jgi:hypothetical protein
VLFIIQPSYWFRWYHNMSLPEYAKTFDAIHLEMKNEMFAPKVETTSVIEGTSSKPSCSSSNFATY